MLILLGLLFLVRVCGGLLDYDYRPPDPSGRLQDIDITRQALQLEVQMEVQLSQLEEQLSQSGMARYFHGIRIEWVRGAPSLGWLDAVMYELHNCSETSYLIYSGNLEETTTTFVVSYQAARGFYVASGGELIMSTPSPLVAVARDFAVTCPWDEEAIARAQIRVGLEHATLLYRPLLRAMCPTTHPFRFDGGASCCASSPGTPGEEQLTDIVEYCDEDRFVRCLEGPCVNNLQEREQVLTSFNCISEYDPYGVGYRGEGAVTRSGAKCSVWRLEEWGLQGTSSSGTSRTHNYCRNIRYEETGPGCFTDSAGQVWEVCQVPACEAIPDPQVRYGYLPEAAPSRQRVQLHHAEMTSQWVPGQFRAELAIDGDFNTAAYLGQGPGALEVWLSGSRGAGTVVVGISVYTNYWLQGVRSSPDVAVELLQRGQYSRGMRHLSDRCHQTKTDTLERRDFECIPEDIVHAVKLTVQDGAAFPIREVQVWTNMEIRNNLKEPVKVAHTEGPLRSIHISLDKSDGFKIKDIKLSV